MHSHVFSLLLVLAAISPYFCTSYPYHYLKLALTWPPGFCTNRNCIRPIPQNFTIHGLWPTNESLPFFSSCQYVKYIKKRPPKPEWTGLATSWPNLTASQNSLFDDNNDFWKYEWEKHGMCSTGTFTQAQYFKKAMELKDRFDYLGQIQKKGMRRNWVYHLSKIYGYLNHVVGDVTDLGCGFDSVNRRSYLEEIRICFDRSGTNVIGCPAKNGFILHSSCLRDPNLKIYFS